MFISYSPEIKKSFMNCRTTANSVRPEFPRVRVAGTETAWLLQCTWNMCVIRLSINTVRFYGWLWWPELYLELKPLLLTSRSRDSVVGIGRYSDWLRGARPRDRICSPGRVKNFLFSTSFRPAMGSTQPPIQWVPEAVSPEIKRPGHEADHLPPTSAEVKKTWCIHPLPRTSSWRSA
jgi:hypothetical protein